ncbi:hypothetical protein HNQ56_000869 [Anaerotaenia torta]
MMQKIVQEQKVKLQGIQIMVKNKLKDVTEEEVYQKKL